MTSKEIAQELKASKTAWLEQYGVPVSLEFVRFCNAIGKATDYLEASEFQRLGSTQL